MSNITPGKDNLSQEKIRQILAAVGSVPSEDAAQPQATDYNWNQPHYFNSEQLEKISTFADKTAAALAKRFTSIYNSDFNVTIDSVTQHFANELLAHDPGNEKQNYYLDFKDNSKQQCGFVTISAETAFAWVKPLLGDSDPKADEAENLSQLEESLLLDIAAAVIKALDDSYNDYNFYPADTITKQTSQSKFNPTEELCEITFDIKQPGTEKSSKAHLLILCKILNPVAGKTEQNDNRLPQKDIQKLMRGHIEQIPVSITTRIASTTLTFEEIVDLQPSDIVLLDKKTNEPAELIVQDKTLFHGQMAKSDGKYAMVITEICKT